MNFSLLHYETITYCPQRIVVKSSEISQLLLIAVSSIDGGIVGTTAGMPNSMLLDGSAFGLRQPCTILRLMGTYYN